MTDMQHSEAQHRYGTAKGYTQTIKMVLMNPLVQTEAVSLTILPTHMLLGFALELYLKAWLLSAGVPSTKVKAFGHRLAELFAEAQQTEMPTVARLDEVVALLDAPHREFTFRYIDGHQEIDAMNWPTVLPILDALDVAVDHAVGASALHGKLPGH